MKPHTRNETTGDEVPANGQSEHAEHCRYQIPSDINNYDRFQAAKYYFNKLGWAVQPLYGPEKGKDNEKGKKALLNGWKSHTAAEIEPEFFERHFGATSSNNLGCVVRPPFVFVDLDSKPDEGESVRSWLKDQPQLAEVPRERTGGGAHLVFVCHDLPSELLNAGEPLRVNINGDVHAELFTDGLNIVLSPSIHKSGHQYHWEVTGNIPEVKWADFCRWFGFETPAKKRGPGRPAKELPWWAKYPEDLGSIDLIAALEKLKVPIRKESVEKSMWAIRCPWSDQHSSEPSSTPGTETVVFVPAGKVPAFDCKHAHCSERSIKELIEWMEQKSPGIIAAHCARLRAWSPGRTDSGGRPEIVKGGGGRPESEFAAELGETIAKKQKMFCRGKDVVEIHTEPTDKIEVSHFHLLTAKDFVTAIEDYAHIGYLTKDEGGDGIFVISSLDEKAARIALASKAFRDKLPRIDRILDTPIPMLGADGEIVYTKSGYDPEFRTWLDPNAPQIIPMRVEDAVLVLDEILAGSEKGGFWWNGDQSRVHGLARLLTPFARGLMNWQKAPCFIISANVQGSGKEICAGVGQVVHTGRMSIGAPLGKQNDDELRKRITSLLRAGVRQIHFANMKGHIDFPSLEAATDNSNVWEDRVLGETRVLRLLNEAEYSLSINNGTWTPDLERRSRCIRLHCPLENPERHQYRHRDFLGFIQKNRSVVLSALAALTQYWDEQGRPDGATPFTSFPIWGRVVGGILVACGYPDPCLPQNQDSLVGDRETRAMRVLFQVAFEEFGDRWVPKVAFLDFIKKTEVIQELFDEIDLTTQGGISKIGKMVLAHRDRDLGGITMSYDEKSKNRGRYRFVRLTDVTNSGDVNGGTGGCVGRDPVGVPAAENNSSNTHTGDNFNASVKPWDGDIPGVPHLPKNTSVVFCKTKESVKRMNNDLIAARMVVACLSPTSPTTVQEPYPTTVHQLSLQCFPTGTVWVIDDRAEKLLHGYTGILLRLNNLDSKLVVTHDGISLLRWLDERYGVSIKNVRCLSTAARLIQNGTDTPHDLDSCINRYCPTDKTSGHHPRGRLRTDTPDPLARKVDDRVLRLLDLHTALAREIDDNDLKRVWDLENRLLPVVAAMKKAGIHAATHKLQTLAEHGNKEAASLLEHVGTDQRIRSNFDPLGQVTGRFSSSSPALQQVTKGPVRSAFRPPSKEYVFVTGDYSQHDIRVLAAVSGDQPLIDAFRANVDYHRHMAASLLGKSPEEVTDAERNIAKAFSIGIVYGRGPDGIAETALESFGVTIEDPHEKLATFLRDHPGYTAWADDCRRRARAGCGEVRTRIGRRRIIPPETDTRKRERILMNTPIQGGAADAFKEAMILVHQRLPHEARIVHCIHDEIIVECPMQRAADVTEIVERSMVEAMEMMFPEVNAAVDINQCEFWGDKD
jgi:DNA polymerase I-like protein with 3'-5' exonuclease and polymerase domains